MKLLQGAVHSIPPDLKQALLSKTKSSLAWNDITPLARNEWICWVLDAKKSDTRTHRINRTKDELAEGKKRPCCWAGCPHRT